MRLLVVLFCIFFYLFGVIQATPTTNTTNTITGDSFKAPSFTTRTRWTIVSSSVLTIFACIYTAIHPNIPSPKDNTLHILRRRLGIMIMALLAPELIVAWAMRQSFSARQVTRQFKESGYPSVGPKSESHEEKESVEVPQPRPPQAGHFGAYKGSIRPGFYVVGNTSARPTHLPI
ncbi:hypothetical protein DFJ58DRAFT_474296 [Suillus subalutaceus]|uniref:uncharacterized protein n=1 Tax=Suillus subalutaceus TaxID=48586 RepID=UPI001B88091B|nr:uncharacterized protein DFJ58DRAFT_474296 [Suillus subalutaceus]KAG1848053.1 hypothetical protein DFJ58DRAFT_474296 [Suillus subalutaceus]